MDGMRIDRLRFTPGEHEQELSAEGANMAEWSGFVWLFVLLMANAFCSRRVRGDFSTEISN